MILPIQHKNDGKEKYQSCEAEIDGRLRPMSAYGYSTLSSTGYGSNRTEALDSLRAEMLVLQQDILDTVTSIDAEIGSVNFKEPDFVKTFREQQARGIATAGEAAALHNAKFVRETLTFVKRMMLLDAAAGTTETEFSFESETEVNVAKQFAAENGFRVSVFAPVPGNIPAFAFPLLHCIRIEHGTAVVTP